MRRSSWKSSAVLVLLLAALTACGGGAGEKGEEAAAPAAPDTAPAPVTPATPAQPAEPGATAATPSASPAGGTIQIDPALPAYPTASGVAGNFSSVGSDTLNNVMSLWAEEFRRIYPSVRIQIEGKGSSTAPPALIAGTAQVGPMSREMKSSEIDAFEKKLGYKPTQIRVAIDALAVYVNHDNPLEHLTLPQVDAIFSRSRACGAARPVETWGDAGVTASPWAAERISLYGRNSASGTYGFFKDHALCGGDFRDTVKEQPGSASVVQGVNEDRNGIGYSGIGYRTSGVKALQIAKAEGQEFFGVDPETVLAGKYPLSRFLYIYVNQPPSR
ncbi:MAG TPA: PstS family phosphate ABC transporter substrate-binding protein, partial [Thermoanaerobaculia bacterium]|nr:PstS family phosphate ABC transporter substrate-binding protein [Thermoanaerobaculia bacterium]